LDIAPADRDEGKKGDYNKKPSPLGPGFLPLLERPSRESTKGEITMRNLPSAFFTITEKLLQKAVRSLSFLRHSTDFSIHRRERVKKNVYLAVF
jgi:hypothetical protein